MKVRELIEALITLDGDALVFRDAGKYDEHVEYVFGAEIVRVNGDGHWWPEDHDPNDEDDPMDEDAVIAVRLW